MNATAPEHNFGPTYESTLTTLGDSMRETIAHFGAQRIYSVGGDFAANLIRALDADGLTVSPASNEMHAGFCACAQAEVEGVGFALTTYTVGSLPCMSAAALAKTEGLPVVFISGAPGEDEVHQHSIHHMVQPAHAWRANYDAALQAFAALGLRSERLQGDRASGQPNIAGYRFFELVKHAWLHREPVFIEVPRNLVFSFTQPLALPPLERLSSTDLVFAGLEHIVHTIEQKLAKAKAPLLYAGEQVKRNPALKQRVWDFCQKYQVPLVSTWFSKGVFDETHPLCLGAYNGVFSASDVRRYLENEVDYVLDIGTSVFAQDTASAFHTGTHRVATIDNKTVVKSTVPHEADLCTIFEQLLTSEREPFLFSPVPFVPAAPAPAGKMDFHTLAATLNACQVGQAFGSVFVPEVGNSFFASYGLRPKATALGINWLTNPWYAAMGTSLPYARVVAENIARQGLSDRVVVITGDGGFHFQLNELIHFQKQGLALTIVYMRNDIFHLGKSGDGPVYHCSSQEFDVLSLVRAYGGDGKRCTTVEAFSSYYQACLQANQGIRLIEVPCSPTQAFQCPEMALLNLFIQCRNGDPDAKAQWKQVCQV